MLILNSLSKEISARILFAENAREIWLDLKENRPQIFQLRGDLSDLVQDQLSISAYFTQLKTLWTELASYYSSCTCSKCSCGGVKAIGEYFQMEYVMCFLMGLNDSFSQIRAQLLLMEPAPSINWAFALIAQEVQQCAISSPSLANATAFLARASSPAHGPHSSSSSSQYKKKEKTVCTHCGIVGHMVDRCYKLHGYPQDIVPRSFVILQ
ncbi:uncharacterized protein LOC111025199 [Momordica charantia]|uniref:Uncharacterized protein LOC111025199 n=1 Tax=Momordica charantia TaxID=3673 RepID=A0A6J1E1U3_MOMCH|nr:uncharacterized protein LOC111025199 [Momordica charantia]